MKNLFTSLRCLALLLAAPLAALAQTNTGVRIGAGATAPDASAALEVVSSSKGLLVPRLTQAARLAMGVGAVPAPAVGLLVYQTDGTAPGFYYASSATAWTRLTDGTTANSSYIQNQTGIIQNGGFRIRGDGLVGGSLGIGTSSPAARLEVIGDMRVGATAASNGQLGTSSPGPAVLSGNNLGQSFLLPVGATLTSVTLTSINTFSTTLTFYQGAGIGGAVLSTPQPISFVGNVPTTLTLATPLPLPAGTYTLGLATVQANGNSIRGFTPSVYADGSLFIGNAAQPAYDMAFTITYSVVGATALYAGTNNRVGIGTDAPGATLDVAGSTRLQGLAGPAGRVLTADADGTLSAVDPATVGDNLGNHIATQGLTGTGSSISGAGLGIRADGGLNLGQNTAGNSISIGFEAGQAAGSYHSLSLGYQAGKASRGTADLFIGYQAGLANTTGHSNTMLGINAGRANTTGDANHFIGINSGLSNVSGIFNHYEGYFAGYNATGSLNYCSGFQAGLETSTGENNHFSGYQSGAINTTGSNNTAVGFQAGPVSGATGLTNAAAFGYMAKVSQDNSLVLGGTGTEAVKVGIGTTAPAATFHVAGSTSTVRLSGLAGPGSRPVVADANGTLGTSLQQTGLTAVGASAAGASFKTITVTFPTAYATAPSVVLCTARNEAGSSSDDTFAITIRSISTTGFTANVKRVDTAAAWTQNLQLSWVAMP